MNLEALQKLYTDPLVSLTTANLQEVILNLPKEAQTSSGIYFLPCFNISALQSGGPRQIINKDELTLALNNKGQLVYFVGNILLIPDNEAGNYITSQDGSILIFRTHYNGFFAEVQSHRPLAIRLQKIFGIHFDPKESSRFPWRFGESVTTRYFCPEDMTKWKHLTYDHSF